MGHSHPGADVPAKIVVTQRAVRTLAKCANRPQGSCPGWRDDLFSIPGLGGRFHSGTFGGANMAHDLASSVADVSPVQFVASGIDTMSQAIRLTQSLFPGEVRVEVEEDPELPDASYLVFNVTAEGTLAEIVNRRMQWHEQIRELIPDRAQRLRLSVDPKA